MTRPKIRTALVIVFSTIGLMFAGFAVFAVGRMANINQNTKDIAANWMPSLGVWSQHVMAWVSNEDFRLFLVELPDGFERCSKSQGFELLGVVVGE